MKRPGLVRICTLLLSFVSLGAVSGCADVRDPGDGSSDLREEQDRGGSARDDRSDPMRGRTMGAGM
jgi:hypothetical protein